MKVLFVTSEAYPLMKTGGLGDVSNSLPNSLHHQHADVRLIMPAYRSVLEQLDSFEILGWLKSGMQQQEVRILKASHPAFEMPILLVDCPNLFDRSGSPYTHPSGDDWPDNPQRFAMFSHAAALVAIDALDTGWKADIVHSNDWQTGLVSAFLSHEAHPPKRIFTIHNIAYDCQFDYGTFQSMHLPPHWWSMELGEFYGRFSMLKAGMIFSDEITTVSPRYAEEICTPEYGYGYATILQANHHKLAGIINGIDTATWNPVTDPLLASNYSKNKGIKPGKQKNRFALLKELKADKKIYTSEQPLIGFVGRLVYQKGIDLLLDSIENILQKHDVLFAIIGSGEKELEAHLHQLTKKYPQQVFSYVGYSERLAHLLEAGSDMFVMPSRYEPCGLNQLYSLQYGTPPIARNTGGLADTIVDTNTETLANNTATGILFDDATIKNLTNAINRAINTYANEKDWLKLIHNGMSQDVSWDKSAREYIKLYEVIEHG